MDRLDRRSAGVNCQERTCDELRESLAEALSEALEFNRRDDEEGMN